MVERTMTEELRVRAHSQPAQRSPPGPVGDLLRLWAGPGHLSSRDRGAACYPIAHYGLAMLVMRVKGH
jgi:hypothetical protein